MEEILQNLTNLQFIDSRIDEIERLRGDLPEEIENIEDDVARLEGKIKKTERDQEELAGEKLRLENEIAESKALVEKYEKQQMTVRNNREYDSLTKEIEAQKQKVENSESRIEEIGQTLESMVTNLEDAKKDLEATIKLLEGKKANLTKVIANTEEEEKKLLSVREEAASKLNDRYLRSYERLRNGLNNKIAVVAMEKGAALGTLLPPQQQVEVRKRSKIIIDENSGRIVVDQHFFDEASNLFSNRVS